jgi:hypothetical protein
MVFLPCETYIQKGTQTEQTISQTNKHLTCWNTFWDVKSQRLHSVHSVHLNDGLLKFRLGTCLNTHPITCSLSKRLNWSMVDENNSNVFSFFLFFCFYQFWDGSWKRKHMNLFDSFSVLAGWKMMKKELATLSCKMEVVYWRWQNLPYGLGAMACNVAEEWPSLLFKPMYPWISLLLSFSPCCN